MDYYSKLCDKTIKRTSKYKHFKPEEHVSSEKSIRNRYIIFYADFDKLDEIMRNYVNI